MDEKQKTVQVDFDLARLPGEMLSALSKVLPPVTRVAGPRSWRPLIAIQDALRREQKRRESPIPDALPPVRIELPPTDTDVARSMALAFGHSAQQFRKSRAQLEAEGADARLALGIGLMPNACAVAAELLFALEAVLTQMAGYSATKN